MNPLKSYLLLVTLFVSFLANGQIVFRHWDESHGLSSDQIRNITTLDDRRMAVRIPNGLMMFDGTKFSMHHLDRSRQYKFNHHFKNVYTNYLDDAGKLWLKSPDYLVVFDATKDKFCYNVDSLLNVDFGLKTHIKDLFFDKSRDVWFITKDDQLLYFDNVTRKLSPVAKLDGEWNKRYGQILDISGDSGESYICTSNGIIKTWDKEAKQFVDCDSYLENRIVDFNQKIRLVCDSKSRRWLMYGNNVWLKRKDDSEWENIISISGGSNFFTSIAVDSKNNVWLGTSWSGLRLIDGRTLKVTELPGLQLESGKVVINDIQDIHVDSQDGVWVGTLWQGLAYHHPDMNPFHSLNTGFDTSKYGNEAVRDFLEDSNGEILIATSFNGIVRYSPASGTMAQERPDLFPKSDVYMCLYRDSYGALWVGTYVHGFIRVMPDGSVQRYNYNPSSGVNISRAVYEDCNGDFWVSVNDSGIGKLDLASGKITMLSEGHPDLLFHKRDYGFFKFNDTEFGVFGENGLFVYNPKNDDLWISQKDGMPGRQYSVSCNDAIIDTRGLGWYATDDGVIISEPDKYSDPEYSDIKLNVSNSLLTSNYISSIIEDKFGQIWMTSASGIVRVIVRPTDDGKWQFDLNVYGYKNGINSGRVSENSAFMDSTGNIYFGGYNGVTYFDPLNLAYDKSKVSPAPLITGITLFDKRIIPGETIDKRIIVESSLLNDKSINLDYDENFLTVHFSSPDYVSGEMKQYKYRLNGYSPDWVEIGVGSEPQAIFTGLPPGEYLLEIITSGKDGVWTEIPATLKINIAPPLWKTWWAYLLYLLFAVGIITLAVRQYNSYKSRKLHEEAEKRELMQREELNQMKFQFFTNISHEFRTPLALIMTPLSHILQTDQLSDTLKDKLTLIYNNAENLLGQVNRLLDFRKLEMGGEKINLSRCRIVQFISYLIDSFRNVTDRKNIELNLDSNISDDTDIYLDTHKLRHILTNLYSNAIKFTGEGGRITTSVVMLEEKGEKFIKISVSDTGIGIPEKDLPKIFDRFFQSHNSKSNPSGSGIGLHLVREYVKIHGGTINVESKEGAGSTFSFTIPAKLHEIKDATTNRENHDLSSNDGKSDKILIVEDNNEFRDFLAKYLSSDFQVMTAVDGVDAIDKITKFGPDIIVTDLMMPRMDGMELISRLKQDIATSHIPIVLLTAKASDESRIEGYKVGADSYISKPFNYDVLQVRVKTLLAQAKKRQQKFRKDSDIEPSAVTITSIDEKLVQKALETVEKNMDNSSFTTVQLGEALGLSRSQLYRKFESITGMSPADFILRMRLKRAAQLLRDTKLNVSEIADMTGFNSIKYFNKHFKEEFSQTPTEYRSSQPPQ